MHSVGALDPGGNVLAAPALSSAIFERLGRPEDLEQGAAQDEHHRIRHRQAAGDTQASSGRRVTRKAPLAHVEGGSGRSEASPTAIIQDTHSVEGVFSELRPDAF